MDEPVVVTGLRARSPADVAAMAVAVQANLAALKVAGSKRAGIPPEQHEIKTPAPGAVRRFREALIDRETLRGYGDEELAVRTRQVWGEFSALCWLFGHGNPHRPPAFAYMAEPGPMQCMGRVHEKLLLVQKTLWRLRFEQRLRLDPSCRDEPGFQHAYDDALSIPVWVNGENVRVCSHGQLVLYSCEVAGTLAALRWATDDRWAWEAPGIMELGASAQTEAATDARPTSSDERGRP